VALEGVGQRVSRNLIHHVPRFCVLWSGNKHLIELNHLHHSSLETEDTGAIYGSSYSWLSGPGTVIRYNFVHDAIGFGRHRDTGEWTSPYFSWGIYCDWSPSGNQVIGNIVTRTSRAGIMLHDGRDNLVENNIVVDCPGLDGEHRLLDAAD
jgi:parallel beta-helix repeat protein